MQTGPGRLFVGSTQSFLQDGLLSFLRGNHSIRYDAAQGPQPQLVQHLRASAVSSAFDPEAKALRFQLSTALQAGEDPVPSPRPPLPQPDPARAPTRAWALYPREPWALGPSCPQGLSPLPRRRE